MDMYVLCIHIHKESVDVEKEIDLFAGRDRLKPDEAFKNSGRCTLELSRWASLAEGPLPVGSACQGS